MQEACKRSRTSEAFGCENGLIQELREPLPVVTVEGCRAAILPSGIRVEGWASQKKLATWLRNLSWFPSADGRRRTDASWLEVFFWGLVLSTVPRLQFGCG